MGRFIDQFDVLLLDMGDTFMFGCDRFDASMGETYRTLGGTLSAGRACEVIDALVESMLTLARDPGYMECYPRVREHLDVLPESADLPAAERDRLAEVFARHEVGAIPDSHSDALKRLAGSHRLGLISNVWSDSGVFREEFRRAGVDDLFGVHVFSSEFGWIKPSRRLFDTAMKAMACSPDRTVYIGDKIRRDVVGASAAGIASVWINAQSEPEPTEGPMPDLTIASLTDLLEV